MVAPRRARVEEQTVQARRGGEADVALLRQFARQRLDAALTRLDAAAGQVPARDIGVAHQQHTARAVEDDAAHAHGEAARQAEVEMDQPREDAGAQRRGGGAHGALRALAMKPPPRMRARGSSEA